MNNQLNEAFASSFVKKYWNDPMFKTVMESVRKKYKDFDINRLTDADFVNTNVKTAVKLNKDVIKFWMHGTKIYLTTRSNSFFDSYLEVKKNKRGTLIGCVEQDAMKCMEQGNKYLESFQNCMILDIEQAMKNGASIKNTQNERKHTRTGAYALMTNRQIKENNIKKYVQMMKDRQFSDGSEFSLVQNVNKMLIGAIEKNGAYYTLFRNIIRSNYIVNYMQGYVNTLVEYIGLLDANGFTLPADANPNDLGINYAKTDEQQLGSIRETLKKGIEKIKDEFESSSAYATKTKKAVDSLLKHTNDERMFHSYCTDTKKKQYITEESYKQHIDIIELVNTQFPIACKNANISNDIMNFDLFITQLAGIREQINSGNQMVNISNFMDEYISFMEDKDKDKYLMYASYYVGRENVSMNDGIYRRLNNYINMISKI